MFVKKTELTNREIQRLTNRYRALADRLGGFGSLSQGSVMPQPPGAWIWTRKVQGKTVTQGLSAEKARKMREAIANYRELDRLVKEMREITQNLIMNSPETDSESGIPKRPKTPLS